MMEIGRIGATLLATQQLTSVTATRGQTDTFQKALEGAIDELNNLQANADDAVTRLAVGDAIDIHDVAIAVQEADIAFQLALQVRNKMVEAYQEVMRMQV